MMFLCDESDDAAKKNAQEYEGSHNDCGRRKAMTLVMITKMKMTTTTMMPVGNHIADMIIMIMLILFLLLLLIMIMMMMMMMGRRRW